LILNVAHLEINSMTEKLRLGVNGAGGRMGQRIVALASRDSEIVVVAALEGTGSPQIGKDAGELAGIGKLGVLISDTLETKVDVMIDFSVPAGAVAAAALCGNRSIPLVVATTGMSPDQRASILSVSHVIPLLIAPSMSLAVNVAMRLVREAGRLLKSVPEGADVEIIERHHRFKEDAPSGTALHFGKIVAEEMGQDNHIHGREGRPGKRSHNEIGYHALRTGDNVGEHTIVFGLMGETLEVTVKGHTRDSYAYGAIAAAKFLATKQAGQYGMGDVLGL
jgi:4-hydroxy-tetrahydrodipicolinate reductase